MYLYPRHKVIIITFSVNLLFIYNFCFKKKSSPSTRRLRRTLKTTSRCVDSSRFLLTLTPQGQGLSPLTKIGILLCSFMYIICVHTLAQYHNYKRRNITLYCVQLPWDFLLKYIHQELSILYSFCKLLECHISGWKGHIS